MCLNATWKDNKNTLQEEKMSELYIIPEQHSF